MELDEYQRNALRTPGSNTDWSKAILGLGLAGEAAEVLALAVRLVVAAGAVADDVKKEVGHGHDLDRAKRLLEYGDVLWYLGTLADADGFTLSEVAEANVAKLRARYPEGFSVQASRERVS